MFRCLTSKLLPYIKPLSVVFMLRFLLCLLLISAALGIRVDVGDKLTMEGATKGTSIVAMQWSSHWQCWGRANQACGNSVLELLPKFLDQYHVDFVNLGLFRHRNPDGRQADGLPPGVPNDYSSFDLACSSDNIKVLYKSTKWELMPVAGLRLAPQVARDLRYDNSTENMYGCFNENANGDSDRVYGIFPFKMKAGSLSTIVIFSHFPHPPGGSSSSHASASVDVKTTLRETLGRKINVLKSASAAPNVIVIADLNLDMPHAEKAVKFPAKKAKMPDLFFNEPGMSSEKVWETMEINGSSSLKSATEYKLTCCSDKTKKMNNGKLFPPAGKSKFAFAFDRVLADFGTMKTVMPLEEEDVKTQYNTGTEECPMHDGAFHKPIIGQITVTD